MEPIFSLPYSEYMVANEILKLLPRNQGYAAYLPFSRQQKGVDFIIVKGGKHATVQVKASRSYEGYAGQRCQYSLWFHNFLAPPFTLHADFYCLFSIYPDVTESKKQQKVKWTPIMLCFSSNDIEEMRRKRIFRQAKNGGSSRFMYVEFDNPKHPFATRGFIKSQDWSRYILRANIDAISNCLS